MNIHSIIETLKGITSSETEGKLELTEDSFLSEITNGDVTDEKDSNGFSSKVCWQDCQRQILPLTWLLLTAICFLLKCIIYVVYWLIERVRCLFTNERPRKVLGISPRINMVLMLSVVTMYFMLLASMLMFFVKDVVLFRPDTYVNDSGAISFPQSCKREHYMFLINSAKCWTNTGIKVLEGDKVTVSASGSFFSKIAEMDSFARSNIAPKYSRVNVLCQSPDNDSTRVLWMYNKKDARFGSLLVQIKDDYEKPSCSSDNGHIRQLEIKECCQPPCFVADSAGVLNFAVNDIYLNDGCELDITRLKEQLRLNDTQYNNVLKNYKKRPQMWYDDNVGDILLSIRIDRKDMNVSKLVPYTMAKVYFYIDDFFYSPCLCCRLFRLGLCLLLWFIIDYAIARRIISKKNNNKQRL